MSEFLSKQFLGLSISTWLIIAGCCLLLCGVVYLIFRKKINALIKKHKSIVLYLVFGVLTTVVNYVVYFPIANIPGLADKSWWTLVANVVAWIAAVIFAFITNKLLVFESKSKDKKTLLREIPSFFGARIVTLLIEEGILALFVTVLNFNGNVVKIIASVVTIVLNYFFSKFFIFKKKTKEE